MMKNIMIMLLILVAMVSLGATTLLTDDFTGTVGTALTANGWTLHSGTATPLTITTPGLTYSGYAGSGIGNTATTGGTSDDNNKAFTSTNSGSVYLAFMYKPTTAATTADYSVMLGSTAGGTVTSFYGKLYVQRDASNNVRFGVTKTTVGSAAYTPYAYTLGTTYLMVIKYTFVTGTANDVVSLFVNPVLSGSEPSATVTGSADTAADPAQLISVCLRQATNTAAGSYDGIRVCTSWSDIASVALATEPVAQPTSLVFSNVTSSSFSVAFTAASPVADGYLAVRKAASAPTVDPVDGNVYTDGTALGDGTVVFSGSGVSFPQTALTPNTGYFYKVYAYNGTGTTINYLITSPLSGNQTTLVALTIPTVNTAAASSITATTATSGGEVTATGGSSVTARGICWGFAINPSLTDNVVTSGSDIGVFVSNMSGLSPLTTYHVRAFATNSSGTGYGLDISFVTASNSPPAAPVATSATTITQTGFVANWNASATATSYKLDVSTSNAFGTLLTGYNNLTVNGLSQSVAGLSSAATYYYRVRAVNTNGTSSNSNLIAVTTSAVDPYNGYYDTVTGLTGDALKTGLHNLIDNNTNSNYDGTKLEMFQVYDNVGGVVRCVYTGRDYTVNSSYNGSSDPNTEHTFAQSWFGTSEASIKKADGHHLYPTNASVNSSRGNLPFGVVTSGATTYPTYNGYLSKRGSNSAGQTVFEPADQHKGNLARALMYFSVRYNMSLSIDGVDMLPTFLVWNVSDPVDTAELTRNTAVYAYQNNRNPFVDHPEYVSYIWGGSAPNTTVSFSPASSIVLENAATITLNVAIQNHSATAATTAQIQLTDGTASDVNNYTTQTITFPAGSSAAQTISVTITDDALIEGTETLVFSLANLSGGTSVITGSYSTYNLTIQDNDIPTPVATAATTLSTSGFTANWDASAGITDYEFDLATDNLFTSFVSGYQALIVTGTSQVIAGLSAGTNYYYRVRALSNETPGTDSNVITATTEGGGFGNVILTTGFEGATTFPTDWTQNSSYVQTNATLAHGGTNYAGENSVSDWIRTPILLNPAVLTFWAETSSATASWTVKVQTSPDASTWADAATYAANGTNTGDITDTYSQKTVNLSLTGSYYIRWTMTARTAGSFYFDDVEVTNTSTPVLPDVPVASPATAITTTGFTANWDAAANAASYRLDVSTANTFATFVTGYEDLSVTGISQAITGLTAATTYFYRVRAYNAVGTSAASNVIETATSAVTIPTVVATDATGITTTGFTANWDAAIGADSYQFDLATDNLFASFVAGYNALSVTGTSLVVTGLTEATTYYYRLRAVVGATAGTSSNVITAITSTSTPGNVILTTGFEGATTFPIGWSQISSYVQTNATLAHGGTNYAGENAVSDWIRTPILLNPTQLIFWTETSSATANWTIKVQTSPDTLTWTDAATYAANGSNTGDITNAYSQKTVNLNLTGSYYIRWTMTARTAGSFYLDDVEVTNTSTPVLPDVPVATAATAITTTGFTANWDAAANATSYRLDVSTANTFATFVTGYEDLTVSGNSQAVAGLTAATPYFYRVRAYNAVGTSAASNVIETATSAITIPTVVATDATGITTTGFTANWDAAIGADSYQFDLATDNLFASFVAGYNALSVTGTSLVVTGLTEATTYYYRLRAVVGATAGTSSNVITAITSTSTPGNVILTTGFEGATTFPAGWSQISSYVQTNATLAHGGTNYAGENAVSDWIRTPILLNPAQLTFWTETSSATANWTIKVQTSPDTLTWIDAATYAANGTNNGDITNAYSQKTVNLNLTGSYYIRWTMTARTAGSFYLDDVQVTGDNTPILPDVPVATAATVITTSGFTANWDAAANAASYRLDVSLSGSFASFVSGYQDLTVNGTSQAVSGLTDGTTYYYRVRAVNADGTSTDSNVISLTTQVIVPEIQAPVVSSSLVNGEVYLSWAPVQGGYSYRVESSDAPDGVYLDVTDAGYLDSGAGYIYWTIAPTDSLKFYRVIAVTIAK